MSREALEKVAAGIAKAGVSGSLQPVDAERVAFVIIQCDAPISEQMAKCLSETWSAFAQGTAFAGTKALVLDSGMNLLTVDEDGRVIGSCRFPIVQA